MQKQKETDKPHCPVNRVQFEVPVSPVSYKLGKDCRGNLHLTKRSRSFQEAIREIAVQQRGFYVHRPGEVEVMVLIFVRYRKTSFRMPGFLGRYLQQVPVCTNVQKAVEDAIKGVFFDDDVQVASISTTRVQVETPDQDVIRISVRRKI